MAVDLIPNVYGMTELHGTIATQQGLKRLLFFVSPQVFSIKELIKELGEDHPSIVRYHEIQAAAVESLKARSFAD
jgi:hypothetical protein